MKKSNIFLTISILLFFVSLFLTYIFLNIQFSFFSHSLTPMLYLSSAAIIFFCSLSCFIHYFTEKRIENDSIYNYGDTESLQVLLNEAGNNTLREDESTKDCAKKNHFQRVPIDEIQYDTKQVEHIAVDFNQLEEDLLTSTKMENLYDVASQWIFTNVEVSYVAFSNITANEKLSIEFYKESIISEMSLVEAVAERTENIGSKGSMIHANHTLSVPFYQKGVIHGFVFLGFPKRNNEFEALDTNFITPFIRILSTACLVIELAKTKEQRSSLQKAFSSYVPSSLVDSFEHDPSVLKIGGEYENLTIMFTDLKEFTTLSETMSPDNLISVLNEYFSEMSGVIEAFGGTVSKLVGDGILAFFGGPGDAGINHAEKGCEAALTMKKYEEILNSKLMADGKLKTPLFTRIGISTGKVILGNIGSEKRLDYTVMGPEVNLASRIEAANKNCDTSILISYETFLTVRNSFECRRAAFMKLKGFSKSVYLFELVGKIKSATEEKMLLANDLADLLGVDANNLLTGNNEPTQHDMLISTHPAIDDDSEGLEELEDADELEELD